MRIPISLVDVAQDLGICRNASAARSGSRTSTHCKRLERKKKYGQNIGQVPGQNLLTSFGFLVPQVAPKRWTEELRSMFVCATQGTVH